MVSESTAVLKVCGMKLSVDKTGCQQRWRRWSNKPTSLRHPIWLQVKEIHCWPVVIGFWYVVEVLGWMGSVSCSFPWHFQSIWSGLAQGSSPQASSIRYLRNSSSVDIVRRISVVVEGVSSDNLSINAGVPQGSVLDPTVFLLYIIDLPDQLQSDIFVFADDTKLQVTEWVVSPVARE